MPSPAKRLLLVGWDSADWKVIQPLIDRGAMKGVEHLVDEGVSGNLTTLEPQLSPMLWTSIATGKHAYHHGVYGFTEVDAVSGRVVPVSAATRQCKTVWEILGESGFKTHVVSWFATQGERGLNGKLVSNMFSHFAHTAEQTPDEWPEPAPGTYWPEDLGDALNELRVSPWEMDGEEVIRLFVPQAHRVDQRRDPNLWKLAKRLAESYSVHAAATFLMEASPDWNFMAVYYRAIDEICHNFMPYHPPKMEGIPQEDFELYQHVVTGAYRAHDLMLQRLIQLAGPETAVMLVSDHGFHSDHLRPKLTPRVPAGITVWHRPQGLIAAKGPGFRNDALIYGARLLDVTPTILSYFELPVGEDMEGRVLREAFAEVPPVETIPSWELTETAGGRARHAGLGEADGRILLEQFEELGYIEPISHDPSAAAEETRRENAWNRARAYMDGGRYEEALPLLEDCYAAYPERADYAQLLGRCQFRLGLFDEAEATLGAALDSFRRTESAHMILARLAIEKGNLPKALDHLEIVHRQCPEEPQLLSPLGSTYLQLRRWEEAETVARKLLEIDPEHAEAFRILARIKLRTGEFDQAAEFALEAVGNQYGNPHGHFLLGAALGQLGEWESARSALATCLLLEPRLLPAYRLLAHTSRALGQDDEAVRCDQQRFHWRRQLESERRERLKRLRSESAERNQQRIEARRARRDEQSRSAPRDSSTRDLEFTLVSGLPRSGTSLMMQMLQAGGLPLMTDGHRPPDEDNPEGYWEWELVKQLPKNPRVLEKAAGKVIKVVSALLPHLPRTHRYKILFMRRPVEEIVRSQWKMLERQGRKPRAEAEHLARTQSRHVDHMIARLRHDERVALLEIDFPDLITNPSPWIARIRSFLDDERLTHPHRMGEIVRPELYRHRIVPAVSDPRIDA